MKHLVPLCLMLFVVECFASHQYVLFIDSLPRITRGLTPEEVVYAEGGVTLAKIPTKNIEEWGERVHRVLGGCGGFIDVTNEIEKGTAASTLVWQEILRDKTAPRSHFAVRGSELIKHLVEAGDKNRYWSFLEELTSFPDRSATSENGAAAANFLAEKATAFGNNLPGFQVWKIATQTSAYQKQPSVVATLEGTDKTLPSIVIGGHMDTFSTNKPGADDDGSGSSLVMETLRTIATEGAFFERTIHFIWYAAEERGLVGSSHVVDYFTNHHLKVDAAIQFDMVGYDSHADADDIFVITDYTSPDLNRTLEEVISTYTEAKVGYTRCGYACSDHANWHRAGIPAVFPFETSFSNLNHRLHTGEDKVNFLTLDHAARFLKVALGFVGETANLLGFRPLGRG